MIHLHFWSQVGQMKFSWNIVTSSCKCTKGYKESLRSRHGNAQPSSSISRYNNPKPLLTYQLWPNQESGMKLIFKSCLFLSKNTLKSVEDEISNAKHLAKECIKKQCIENNIIPMVVINNNKNDPLKEEVLCDYDFTAKDIDGKEINLEKYRNNTKGS